jgi:hypothetical protein
VPWLFSLPHLLGPHPPAPQSLRREDREVKAILGHIARPCLTQQSASHSPTDSGFPNLGSPNPSHASGVQELGKTPGGL